MEMANNFDHLRDTLATGLRAGDLDSLTACLAEVPDETLFRLLERFDANERAVLFRLLPRDRALKVFEQFDPGLQSELFMSLRDDHVVSLFEMIDPDDRAALLDELPAILAKRLMRGLSPKERELTAPMLGYGRSSIGRRMSPEYVRLRPGMTVADALGQVRAAGEEAETVYLLPVADDQRFLVGVLSMRELLLAAPEGRIGDVMKAPVSVRADADAEEASQLCVDMSFQAVPVVDTENRLVGILTFDDASRILADAYEEDIARAGAREPLRRPYLSTPVLAIVRSRIVWLLILAISAVLTVQVLEFFEGALETAVVLALFIPLLTGVGGNTGSQAATTVTRSLATGDVRLRDTGAVLMREVAVGFVLGAVLGAIGFGIASLVYDHDIGLIIGLTLVSVCTLAATVGGVMPMIATLFRVDPAVFSTPFISTFCDATGLVIYFLIASAILRL